VYSKQSSIRHGERETPPALGGGADSIRRSAFDEMDAGALDLFGGDDEPKLLLERPGEGAEHGVRLQAGVLRRYRPLLRFSGVPAMP
jgi:hypothetical protein